MNRFSLWLRRRAPKGLRHIARVARLSVERRRGSPALPAALFENCRVCASREALIAQLPRGGRVAEVGVDRGAFSKHILERAAPRELHLIDLDFGQLAPGVADAAGVRLHRGRSQHVLAGFEDASFDWIYIDADHSYAGAAGDARAAAPKVKPGGYLVFNDFAHIDHELGVYGVHRAVAEFALAECWPLAWWAYHPSALYDVALQRPL